MVKEKPKIAKLMSTLVDERMARLVLVDRNSLIAQKTTDALQNVHYGIN